MRGTFRYVTLLTISGLVGSALLVSCRMSRVGVATPEQPPVSGGGGDAVSSRPPVIQPQKQVNAGVVLNVSLDAEGKIKETLSLRLDYFPAPRADGVSVPTCYEQIAGHLVVGRLVCSSNGNLATDILASQVRQQCYTSSPARIVDAKSQVVLVGCQGPATIETVRYEPDIRLSAN